MLKHIPAVTPCLDPRFIATSRELRMRATFPRSISAIVPHSPLVSGQEFFSQLCNVFRDNVRPFLKRVIRCNYLREGNFLESYKCHLIIS